MRKKTNRQLNQKKTGRKSIPARILCLLALVLGVGMAIWTLRPADAQTDDAGERIVWTGDTIAAEQLDYGDGDTLLRPGTDDLRYDEESGTLYFQNLLVVFFAEEPQDGESEKLAETVNGEVVGLVTNGCWLCQIRVPETDFAGLTAHAEQLMEQDNVLYARYDYPSFIEPSLSGEDTNSWDGSGPYSFDEESHDDGANWWAEAIGAYTAWQYTDLCGDYTIGIVDSGFDLSNSEYTNRIRRLFEQDPETLSQEKSSIDHGSHVAGIIGAENNTEGIRGVADTANLLVLNRTGFSDSAECTVANAKLIQAGARVVNNSYGFVIASSLGRSYEEVKKYPLFWDWKKVLGLDYEEYIQEMDQAAYESGLDALLVVHQIMTAGEDQFLIVQAAGNGYDNAEEEGLDCSRCGWFDSVSLAKKQYESRIQTFYEKANGTGYSYDELRKHILIVGGTDVGGDAYEGYNYGSEVDIYAPSRNIYSTISGNEYDFLSGTSMAAPMVTASAAMLWAICPELSTDEVRSYLLDNGTETVDHEGQVRPMLNVGKAVEALVKEKNITEKPKQSQQTENSEQTRQDADDKANHTDDWSDTGSSGAASGDGSSDTSEGTYRMSGVAEHNGKLYYVNNNTCTEPEDEVIYCMDPVTGENSVFLTGSEERHFMGVLATQQYLYIRVQTPSRVDVELYTYDGKQVGCVMDVNASCVVFDGGYLYYGATEDRFNGYHEIYRVPVSEGAAVLADENSRTTREQRQITPETDSASSGFVLIDDFLYYWSDGVEEDGNVVHHEGAAGRELVRLAKDGSQRETLSTELSDYASLEMNDERLVYDGSIIDMSRNQTPAIVYTMQISGASVIQDQELFRGKESDQTLVESMLDGGNESIGGGYVIGNVYVYTYYGTDKINSTLERITGSYVYHGIYGYNLDTGENFLIAETEESPSLTYVPGQSRVYFRYSTSNGMECHYVEVYGSGEVQNLPDTLNNAFSQQYYQYDY